MQAIYFKMVAKQLQETCFVRFARKKLLLFHAEIHFFGEKDMAINHFCST